MHHSIHTVSQYLCGKIPNTFQKGITLQKSHITLSYPPRSILASGTFFREDLVMKLFLRPFFLFRGFKKSSCQLMPIGCALSTGYLPRGGLPRNNMDRITDRPDITSAVDRGRKASTQTIKQKHYHIYTIHFYQSDTALFDKFQNGVYSYLRQPCQRKRVFSHEGSKPDALLYAVHFLSFSPTISSRFLSFEGYYILVLQISSN